MCCYPVYQKNNGALPPGANVKATTNRRSFCLKKTIHLEKQYTMRIIQFTLLTFFGLFSLTAKAQLNIEDFQLSGTAQQVNDQCIRLVPDFQYVSGSAWYKKAIDLSQPFEMEICLVLGEKDLDGADGIVFVFHPNFARTGWRGEGMGFAGLRPSLGIEFDTYLNYHLGDPEEDHIAIMANGQTHHALSLVGPVLLPNLEDNNKHLLRIIWDPSIDQLQVYLDSEKRVTYNSDIVKEIFNGQSAVYWGVTAATGRLSNDHQVCIKKLIFAEADPQPGEEKEAEEKVVVGQN